MEKTRDDVLCGVSGVVLRSLKPVCADSSHLHVSLKALAREVLPVPASERMS